MKIFISRRKEQVESLCKELESLGHQVQAQSLIRTEEVDFPLPLPHCDWIFFSSAEAVRFFFRKNPVIPGIKIGAVGESTAEAIRQFSHVDYTGDSSDIDGTAKHFASHTEGQLVLFPGSEQSLRSIQSCKKNHEVMDLVCYRTIREPVAVAFTDVLVFSSPSNVEAFFAINQHRSGSKYIAFGKSTAACLEKFGISNAMIPQSLTDRDLLHAIKSVS
jgi:hydroxymethylbilane synthase